MREKKKEGERKIYFYYIFMILFSFLSFDNIFLVVFF